MTPLAPEALPNLPEVGQLPLQAVGGAWEQTGETSWPQHSERRRPADYYGLRLVEGAGTRPRKRDPAPSTPPGKRIVTRRIIGLLLLLFACGYVGGITFAAARILHWMTRA